MRHIKKSNELPVMLVVIFILYFPLISQAKEADRLQISVKKQSIGGSVIQLPIALGQDSASSARLIIENFTEFQNDNFQDNNFQWQETSQVITEANGGVFKYTRTFDGIPIINDWAIVVLGSSGAPVSMQYEMTQMNRSAANNGFDSSAQWLVKSADLIQQLQPHEKALAQKTLKKAWLRVSRSLEPVYILHSIEKNDEVPHRYANVYSARDGVFLERHSLTDSLAFSYRVYADTYGTPYDNVYGFNQPHPTGVADGSAPESFASQNIITVEETSDSSDDPWLWPNATESVGNNVDVFFNSLLLPDGTYDFGFDGGAYGPEFQPEDGDFRAQIASGSALDYIYDPTISENDFFQLPSDPAPSNPSPNNTQINAKLVQAFYMANYMRDRFYDAGFTEQAGNAQTDNFGRGGIDSDPMIIHGNCRSTFISTPEDGLSPVMCLGVNNSSSSRKDASFDYSVFAHEWSHYMYRRLVNGLQLGLGNQARSLNEGWADFLGIFMSLSAEDFATSSAPGFLSSYTMGAYFNTDYAYMNIYDPFGTEPDAYFYGTRRWPYGPSNPLSFRHIEHQQELPAGYAFFDWKWRSKFNSEFHSAGEIWAASVWDCYRSIFAQRTDKTFDENRQSMTQYIVAGMVATPPNPTFTEARDGLLTGIKSLDSQDWHTCRQSFANRGMGAGALSPERDSNTHRGVVESFSNADLSMHIVGSTLDDSLDSLDNDGILDRAEAGVLNLRLKNTGFEDIALARLELLESNDYQILTPMPIELNNIAVGGEISLTIALRLLHDRHYDATSFSVAGDIFGPLVGQVATVALEETFKTQYDVNLAAEEIQSLDFANTMDLWQQDVISRYFYVDTQWNNQSQAGNAVLHIEEEYGGFQVMFVSPWLQKSADDFLLSLDHAYDLSEDSGQFATVEYSLDDKNWARLTDLLSNQIDFLGRSASFPSLINQQLTIAEVLPTGSEFKLRFNIVAYSSLVALPAQWTLDNLSLTGVVEQPFLRVYQQQANDVLFANSFE